jgi:hypothetical protein
MQTNYFRVGNQVNTPAPWGEQWPVKGTVVKITPRAVHVMVNGCKCVFHPSKLSHAEW